MQKEFGLFDAIRTMVPQIRAYSGVCGEDFDHTEECVYEDETLYQWVCKTCGAEGWEGQ